MNEKNRRNYYRLLHVQPDAPLEVIKASYRTLMRTLKNHPDLGGHVWNAALINEAYAVLSNPARREQYDRERHQLETRGGPITHSPSSVDPTTPVGRPADPEPAESATPAGPKSTGLRVCAFCEAHNGQGHPGGDEYCHRCGAPLRLVHLTMTDSRRRATERIDHNTDMSYRADPSSRLQSPGRVVDLSPTGLQFLSRQRLSVGCVIKIDTPTLSAVATVTRSTAHTTTGVFSIGVRFLTLALRRPRGTFVSTQA